jgi:fructokinase
VPVVLDLNLRPPFYTPEILRQSAWLVVGDCLKVNEQEYDQLPKDSPLFAAMVLCVTRGANGCTVRIPTDVVHVDGVRVPVADTVGCGDAFTAAFLTRWLEDKRLREAARFANAYAAVVASKPGGTPPVERAEVERLL